MSVNDGINDIVGALARYYFGKQQEREAREAAELNARRQTAHEAEVRRQQAEWEEEVKRQRAHGDAGDATELEAITALGGERIEFDEGFVE